MGGGVATGAVPGDRIIPLDRGESAEKRRSGCCPESAIKPPFVHAPLETRGEQGKPHAKEEPARSRRYEIRDARL